MKVDFIQQSKFQVTPFLLLLLVAFPIHLWSQSSTDRELTSNYETEYVIVLVIDGVRFSESFGDTSCTYIPNLCNELREQGTLYTNFRATAPKTTTNAGHTAITTSVNQRISNSGRNFPRHPSMFNYLMKEQDVDKSKLWVISSKGKLSILGNTRNRKWRNKYQPSVYCGKGGNNADYVNDRATWNKVLHVVDTYQPKLMLINLLAPDVQGHGNNWEGYLNAIKNSDAYALELWNRIQENEVMKDKTTLIITNDHGRNEDGHKDGFISHGDGSEGNRHIFLLGLGPDFKSNYVVEKQRELIDIAPTIAHLLGFEMPTARGVIMEEMLKNN